MNDNTANQSCKTYLNSNMMNLVILFKRQSREDKPHDIIICLLSMFDTALFFSSILKFEDIKELIRRSKSERQCNGQKKKGRMGKQ